MVTHDDYVTAVAAALDAVRGPVVRVGDSFGGSVISRVAELRPERFEARVVALMDEIAAMDPIVADPERVVL